MSQEDSSDDATGLRRTNNLLRAELEDLRVELDRRTRRTVELEQKIKEVDDRSRALQRRFTALELQHTQVTNLYIASYRLLESLEERDLIAVIVEIVINLIGSEEFGIYELSSGGDSLHRIGSFGLDHGAHITLPITTGRIARAMKEGALDARPAQQDATRRRSSTAADDDGDVAVCLPLRMNQRVVGAIVIFSLLPHKPALTGIDYELCELLATNAANALRNCRLNAKSAGGTT